MAIMDKRDQLLYVGRGPIDAKALVKTYNDLINPETWTTTVDGEATLVAYNGMLVAVWLNKDDASKNGLYFLFDSSVTSALKKPDVTKEANWHKLAEMSGLADFTKRLSAIEANLESLDARLVALEDESSDVIIYGYRKNFPTSGEEGKLYVAAEEGKSYVWFNTEYLPVGVSDYETPDIICGGTAG